MKKNRTHDTVARKFSPSSFNYVVFSKLMKSTDSKLTQSLNKVEQYMHICFSIFLINNKFSELSIKINFPKIFGRTFFSILE